VVTPPSGATKPLGPAQLPTPKLETHPPMPQRAASLSRFGVRARYNTYILIIQRRAQRPLDARTAP
jgi:hypothetical protein